MATEIIKPTPVPPAAPKASAPPAPPADDPTVLVDGKKRLLTSLVGRLVHPYQANVEFNAGQLTSVMVDEWVRGQFTAGKLGLADVD